MSNHSRSKNYLIKDNLLNRTGTDAMTIQAKRARFVFELRRHLRLSGSWALSTLLTFGSVGCTAFSARSGSMKDYNDAKRSIENPTGYGDGITRPEGKTAEKDTVGKAFLQRIGLQKARRKDIELARKEFREGDAMFEKAKELQGDERSQAFRAAAKKYQSAAKNWQSSGLEQDALMAAGESLFFAEDYYRAEEMYSKLVKEYPRNRYLDQVDSRRFEIADYWLKHDAADHKPFTVVNFIDNKRPWNDTGGHGTRVLEAMRIDNPTGRVSDDATMRLAVAQYEKGKFEGAADTFADLRMTYPDSEHQFQAQFLELQSLMNSYQGPKYSPVPLDEAERRVKQIAKQFPKEAGERQQDLNVAFAKIRFLYAERHWHGAEYRRSRGENGSARFHYQKIIDDYSDTPFAKEAEAKMTELAGLPEDPPQRFAPLVKLFGQSKSEQPLLNSGSNK
jgi:outer membrane protein assembly factor BamD (BamD/ComL family)